MSSAGNLYSQLVVSNFYSLIGGNMAKEWEKFQADYKKLKPAIDKHTVKAAEAIKKRLQLAKCNCNEGEDNLTESMPKARKNGVTGDTLADFMKDKVFSEAKKLLDKAVVDLVADIKELTEFCAAASATANKVGVLYTAIGKDLKSRKDKSESKKDIEALEETTLSDYQELTKAGKIIEKVDKQALDYVGNYMKTIEQIVATAPEVAESKMNETEMPQLLVDRNIKGNLGKVLAAAKKVGEACDGAIEAAGEDVKAALPLLKDAQVELAKIKVLNDQYQMVSEKYKEFINASKDKVNIQKMVAAMAKAYETAERQLRGAATTIKKAG